MIREDITITSYDKNRFVISTQEGRNILVNSTSVKLIDILKDAPDIKSAQQRFNNQFNSNLDVDQFESFIQDKLGRFGILQDSKNITAKRPFEYLTLRFELLSPKVVSFLSGPLKFLYRPKIFWPCAALCIVLLAVTFWNNTQSISFNWTMIYKIGGLILLSLLVHELGHTAACVAAGFKPGGIGVGLYYFLPVLYADITAIWSTKRPMRIIANLGGIFSELLLSSALAAFFLVTSQPEYLATAFYIFVKLLIQLNPFTRLDGYWVLSDMTNTPNLLKKSNQMVAKAMAFSLRTVLRRRIMVPKLNRNKVLLLTFGMANWSFLIVFVFYTMNTYHRDMVTFPGAVKVIFEHIINFDFDSIEIKRKFIVVLTFYFLIIRLVTLATMKIFQNRLKKVGLTENSEYTL